MLAQLFIHDTTHTSQVKDDLGPSCLRRQPEELVYDTRDQYLGLEQMRPLPDWEICLSRNQCSQMWIKIVRFDSTTSKARKITNKNLANLGNISVIIGILLMLTNGSYDVYYQPTSTRVVVARTILRTRIYNLNKFN